MNRADIPVGGRNGKEIYRELDNFAASEITLGVWHPGINAGQDSVKVASQMLFWRERNPNQRTLWQPCMTLSTEYYKSLLSGEHIAPIHWPGFIALQHNARAMDIFVFLVYRLRKPLSKPVPIQASDLHQMFGKDCKHLYHFWPRFIAALKQAHKHYQAARLEVTKEGLKLYSSPALIRYQKTALLA